VSSDRASSLVRPLDGLYSPLICPAFAGIDGLVLVGGIVSQGSSYRGTYKLIIFCRYEVYGIVHLSTPGDCVQLC